MKINLIGGKKSYLPERFIYKEFLEKRGHSVDLTDAPNQDADIVWWFCGIPANVKGAIQIHEYASSSVPPFAGMKDFAKRFLISKPNYRVFLNQNISDILGFRDEVPYDFRDMGVRSEYFSVPRGVIDYDFVYLGEMSRLLYFKKSIDALGRSGLKTLFIGNAEANIREWMEGYKSFQLTGRVSQKEIPDLLVKCKAGLNFMPKRKPYTNQTSTKVLEYLATGLSVVSDRYSWINKFSSEDQNFLWIEDWPADEKKWHEIGTSPSLSISYDREIWRKLEWTSILEKLTVWSKFNL